LVLIDLADASLNPLPKDPLSTTLHPSASAWMPAVLVRAIEKLLSLGRARCAAYTPRPSDPGQGDRRPHPGCRCESRSPRGAPALNRLRSMPRQFAASRSRIKRGNNNIETVPCRKLNGLDRCQTGGVGARLGNVTASSDRRARSRKSAAT
jgi:hypothetical protein